MKLPVTFHPPGGRRRPLMFQKLMLSCLLAMGCFANASAQIVYGLSGSTLFSFDLAPPTTLLGTAPIVGVASGQTIEGIDFRPNTGELYAIGYNQGTGEARLYTINPISGAATAVGAAAVTLQPNMGAITFDFNPTVDRIRLMGSNGTNYRLHPVTGAIAATDGTLAYAMGDLNASAMPFIATGAYTNSYIAATSTTLYNYDAALNVLTSQNPPNNGTQNTIGITGLQVSATDPIVDMDIFFDAATQTNTALLVAATGFPQTTNFYTVNLATGLASPISAIGLPVQVDDIAVFIDRSVPAQVTGQLVYALTTTNNLISFDSDLPTVIRSIVPVAGVAMGQAIAGIDFRPNTGELYAIGYNQTNGEARLYTLNLTSGAATAIGAAPVTLAAAMGQITFDFNPTVDRIRVMGSSGANYRMHPVTGAIVATDGNLAYSLTDANAAATPFVAASAYTNSYIGANTTTLYNYDAALNILTTQIPPNNGTLNTVGMTGITVSPITPLVDMDIFFDAASATDLAFVSAATVGSTASIFYTMNLATGAATSVGNIGLATSVNDIAVFIDRSVPAQVTGQLVYAVTGNNNLISFDSDLPGIIRSIVPVAGVFAAQTLVGLDFRPATGDLYGIGYNNLSGIARLYTINLNSGAATAIGADSVLLAPGMGAVTFDFNPTVDRIRVMGSNGLNFRMHPETGAVVATDGTLNYATGDPNMGATPFIGTGAYINSFGGSTTTTLYDYDYALNILASQIPPNNGTLNTIGATGITVNATSPTIGMDIFYQYSDASNTAYLNANTGTSMNDHFYKINLSTGTATLVGGIGFGIPVRNIAVVLDTPPPPPVPVFSYQAQLSGHHQAFPVATAGSGTITATLTGNELVVTGNYANMTGLIDLNIAGGAHIHAGYAGQNGGIELELVPTPGTDLSGGTFTAALNTFTLTPTQIDRLNSRQLYVNIHTTVYPAGEIRGQLLPAADSYFSSNLFGSNEMPAVFSNGSGALALELRNDTLVVSGSFDNLDGEFDAAIAGGAHLHLGLAGQNGGIALGLHPTVDADLYGGIFAPAENTFVLTAAQITALQSQQLYANIHTSAYASGELRGQVVGAADAVFRAHLAGANEYPFVLSLANGQVIAALRGNTLTVSGRFNNLESNVTDAHIHTGMAGQNGGVAFGLTYVLDANSRGGVFQAAANTFTLTAAQVAAFLSRGLYVNIHTMGNPGGEIRGQLLLESQTYFTAYLTGSQSVPDVSSGGHGTVAVEVSGGHLTFSGGFGELGSGVDVSIVDGTHLHHGLPGLTGEVLFPLAATLDADLKGGVYLPLLNSFAIEADQLQMVLERATYINIHTLNFPSGEIRGNLLAEASAYFFSPLGGASQTPAENVPASGILVLEVTGNQATAVGSFSALGTDFDPNFLGGAHLHAGYAGSNGDILAELEASFSVDFMNGVFEAQYNAFEMTAGFLDSLRTRQVYTNIHTLGVQAGEVRGQLMPLAGSYFHATLMGINETTPVNSPGNGGFKLELNGNTLTVTGSFADLDGQFDANVAGGSHIHIGEVGTNGGIAFPLVPTVAADLQNGFFTAAQNRLTLTTTEVNNLRNGLYYTNLHTTSVQSGELRGQILPEINYFPSASELTAPLAGTMVNVGGLPTEQVLISWLPSIDPDGNMVAYVWQVATDIDFNNIVYMEGTTDLFTTITYGELDALLAVNGIGFGGSVTLYHRIMATDGSNATASEALDVTFTRGPSANSEVLAGLFDLTVLPNVTAGQPVTLQVNAQQSSEAQLLLMNSNGQVLESRKVRFGVGQQDFKFEMQYSAGAYYLSVKTEQGTLPAKRIMVIK